ncbi:DUF3667 domain-containing protein [Sediminibacterium roseum]|uniref:DUF3667 domain-containing protein n=1 Tax=Sediminibacterium roseum TaxID=1978412 RepID=A0ABW9ZSU7_9BACT|nr:DUF3667 domain-containing protein [Sediminibacterium roseum]NCI49507.1 DUF3667 domain-containing protein [Sediminibacterium roseum]
MSHLTERKEKDCLNCGAVVQGRYCHVCGQENIEPKESFWHLTTHFVYDITHFDGKFFSTLKYLLFRPGFLSHEYLKGRRASYLHPIRMYVFTSAFFFLIFFSIDNNQMMKINDSERTAAQQMKRLEKKKKTLEESIAETDSTQFGDSTIMARVKRPLVKKLALVDSEIVRLRKDTLYKTKIKSLSNDKDFNNFLSGQEDTVFKSVAAYDSAQARLPKDKRDGYIGTRFMHQKLHLNEKYNGDGKAIWKAVLEKFNHLVPQMLFVSLPLFALILQLMYARRKSFYYVNHVVFTIHLYCGTFIIILAGMLVDYLLNKMGWMVGWDNVVFGLLTLFFMYKSMRNFYHQRRAKTILKYCIILFLSLFIMTFLFTFFFIFSAMTI